MLYWQLAENKYNFYKLLYNFLFVLLQVMIV